MPGNALEFVGTVFVKNVKSLIFWHKLFLKKTFHQDNNVNLIFILSQINKTRHFLNLAENVRFTQIQKSEISPNFQQFF